MDSDSDISSQEDFIPIGINMLNINSNKDHRPVMVQKTEKVECGLPPQLQYMALLDYAMNKLNKSNEEETDKLKLPLKVVRKSRKTMVNVVEIANILNRQPEHLSHFLSESVYSEGSINKDGNLILSGSFLQSDIEKGLRNFIELYVVCKSCDSVEDTYIVKENKLFFLKCDKCKGSRCVGNTIEGLNLKDKTNAKLRGFI